MGGSDVNPPIPRTTSAPCSLRIPFDWQIVLQSRQKKGSIFGERVGGLAIAGTVLKSRAPYLAEASASTFLREIRRSGW
jgi:hypothetical protein